MEDYFIFDEGVSTLFKLFIRDDDVMKKVNVLPYEPLIIGGKIFPACGFVPQLNLSLLIAPFFYLSQNVISDIILIPLGHCFSTTKCMRCLRNFSVSSIVIFSASVRGKTAF